MYKSHKIYWLCYFGSNKLSSKPLVFEYRFLQNSLRVWSYCIVQWVLKQADSWFYFRPFTKFNSRWTTDIDQSPECDHFHALLPWKTWLNASRFPRRISLFFTMTGHKKNWKLLLYNHRPSSGDSPVHIQDKLINYLSPACVRQTTNNSLCFLSKDSVKDVFWNKSVRLPLWRFYPPVKIKSFRTGSNTHPVQICFWKLKHRLNYLIYNPDHVIMPWYWSLVKINNRIFTWPKR